MGYMTDGLTFNVLNNANEKRIPLFKNKKGELVHNENGTDWTPSQWLQAIVGELGEYANLRKKFERGDINQKEFYDEACKELADVQIYLSILANQLEINLGRATISKFNEVSDRIGVNIKIKEDGSDWYFDNKL